MPTVRRVAERSAPRQGRATLRVTVDEDGTVSSVVASGAGWEGVAQAIQAALAGRRLRVPAGAHGVVLSFAASATFTRTPPVLTGEARATPMIPGVPAGMEPPTDDTHRGLHTPPSNMAVVSPLALLPLARHGVTVELVGEQLR